MHGKLDYKKLLGFGILSAEMVGQHDFQGETFGDKLGAKVGNEPPPGPTLFQDETFADKLGAKIGVEDGGGASSDVRLKWDIEPLATRWDGLPIYAFKYLWDYEVHVGVMAQDLLRNELWRPAVFTKANGYFAVDYRRLGLRMTTLDEWRTKGMAALEPNDNE